MSNDGIPFGAAWLLWRRYDDWSYTEFATKEEAEREVATNANAVSFITPGPAWPPPQETET